MAQPTGGTGGSHYSYGELEGLWIAAGGPRRLAPLMAAIAMAESRGNPRARNPSGATGLWQILGQVSPGNLYDPQVNARNAVVKWKTQGLGAWVTYTSGAYHQFFKRGVAPVDPGGDTGTIGIPYRNPFRAVKNLRPERIDMGVDYAGTGPVYALGEGVITSARTGTGWGPPAGAAPGGFIGERLTSGPLKGRYVYVAEGIQPAPGLRPGQHVTGGTVIGRMVPSATGIETGFATPPGTGNALAGTLGEYSADGVPTAAGVAYANVLAATGTPRGIGPKTVKGGAGTTPPWIAGILKGLDFGTGGAGSGGLGGIASAIESVMQPFAGVAQVIDFLLLPSNWVRILAGVGGAWFLFMGIFALSHVGGTVPGTGISVRPAALPIGILEVGAGAMLLFIAFHNLPGEPSNIGEVLGDLRDAAQGAGKQAA